MATNKTADVLQRLRDGVTELTESAKWEQYLAVQRRFHEYSWGNCLLIAIQRPDATHIAGYRAWQKLNRQVQVGEKGIAILAPMVFNQRPTEGVSTEKSEEARVVRAFRAVSVFDVSQTKGEPLPEVATRLLGEDPVFAWRSLSLTAGYLGMQVEIADLPGERNGDCNFDRNLIRVQHGLAPAQLVKTLAHELGHTLLHWPSELPKEGMPRELKELEAESVAYVVCQELGIDSSEYSFGYIAHWAGDGKSAAAGIDVAAARIRKASQRILDTLESPTLATGVRAQPLRRTAEELSDEMTAGIRLRKRPTPWPEPIHSLNVERRPKPPLIRRETGAEASVLSSDGLQ